MKILIAPYTYMKVEIVDDSPSLDDWLDIPEPDTVEGMFEEQAKLISDLDNSAKEFFELIADESAPLFYETLKKLLDGEIERMSSSFIKITLARLVRSFDDLKGAAFQKCNRDNVVDYNICFNQAGILTDEEFTKELDIFEKTLQERWDISVDYPASFPSDNDNQITEF